MCDFCKNIVNNDGKWKNSLLASRRSNDKSHGLDIILGKTDGKFKIEGSKFIRDAEIDEPVIYLKAVNWRKKSDSENPMAWTTAMEIHYCPICGEKL